ncbi:hypothetical protein ONZ45_g10826 [Pleurotus djamor]|nr:hypothetical protein ONZ45_g10826 [Pleurotus djamor]
MKNAFQRDELIVNATDDLKRAEVTFEMAEASNQHASSSTHPDVGRLTEPSQGRETQPGTPRELDPEEYHHAKKKLKRAVIEHYRGLEALKNYRILNITGFRKALKKFEKFTRIPIQHAYMTEKVETSAFYSEKALNAMVEDMEDMYTAQQGNRKRAKARLRANGQVKSHHFSTFRSGITLGLALPALVSGIYMSFQPETREAIKAWDALLFIYGILLLPVLFSLLVGLNVLVWSRSRINYVFIFELDVRSRLDYHPSYAVLNPVLRFLAFILTDRLTFRVSVSVAPRMAGFHGRGPIQPVSTPVQAFQGGKYASGILSYLLYYIWRHKQTNTTLALWCIANTLYAAYASSWDLLMDWSVLRFNAEVKYPLLRPELVYTENIPLYYFAIISNVLLRFVWTFYIPARGPNIMIRTFIGGFLELLRRWQWNFYRLENEHLGNVDQYRITREVPLPYSFDESHDDDVDEEDGVVPSGNKFTWLLRRRPISGEPKQNASDDDNPTN